MKIFLNHEMTIEKAAQIDADVVIMATGGTPRKLNISGVDLKNVFTAWETLIHPEKVGKKILVIGGGSVGAETAEFLLDHQKDVTLIEMLPEIASDKEKINRKVLLCHLGEKGAKIRVLTQVKAIRPEEVEVEFNGRKEILIADTVVLATGIKENKDLEEALKGLPVKLFLIGDCVFPRKAIDAIYEGFKTALEL